MTTVTAEPGTRRDRRLLTADAKLVVQHRMGPVDRLPADILALLPRLPDWPADARNRGIRLRGAATILDWLLAHPGEGWQDRWTVSGADRDAGWIDTLAPDDTRRASTRRHDHIAGLGCLLMCRVVLPSYDFLTAYRASGLFDQVQKTMRPGQFARLGNAASERGLSGRDRAQALRVISKIVLHTGADVDALTPDDVLELFAWSAHAQHRRHVDGLHAAWDLLGDIGVTPAGTTLRAELRRGQKSTAELVDQYRISCRPVRDVLVRYLDERRPALHDASLRALAGELAGTFWADIERQHPGISTLHLPGEIAREWKERLRVITAADGTVRERRNIHALLMAVRAFDLDIQQWALEDPSWVPWAVPSPVRRNEIQGAQKARKRTVAAMHQRVRERLPHLPELADAAGRRLAETAGWPRLLTASQLRCSTTPAPATAARPSRAPACRPATTASPSSWQRTWSPADGQPDPSRGHASGRLGIVLLAFYGQGGQPVPAAADRSGNQLLQALPPSELLTSDKGQPFVFGEVGEALGVECRKRELIDQAAGGYPGVVVRPGTSAPLRAGLELSPSLRHRFVVFQGTDTRRHLANSAVRPGPQDRSTRHFISSPTVTKVIHIVWPASAARSRSGRRLRKLADATSASRTIRLTACWRGERRKGRRGIHPAPHPIPTRPGRPRHRLRQSAEYLAGIPVLRPAREAPRSKLAHARHRWTSLALLPGLSRRRPPHTSAGRDPRECHQWGSLLVPHVRHVDAARPIRMTSAAWLSAAAP